MSNIRSFADLNRREQAAANPISPASSITQESSSVPQASAPNGRTMRTDMMSNASGITLSGGTFINVGGTILRPMASTVAATSQPDTPVDVDENDSIITSAFHKVDNLTVTPGATVKIDNIGTQLMHGQRPKKGQNKHTTLFDGLTNSTFGGGVFTNASSVTYYPTSTSSSGEETPDEGI